MRGKKKKKIALSSNLGFSGAKGRKHWLGSSFSGYLNLRQAQSVNLSFLSEILRRGKWSEDAQLVCISLCFLVSLKELIFEFTHLFLLFLIRSRWALLCFLVKVLLDGLEFEVLLYWIYSPLSLCVVANTNTQSILVPSLFYPKLKTVKVLIARYSLSLPLKSARVSCKTFRRYPPL